MPYTQPPQPHFPPHTAAAMSPPPMSPPPMSPPPGTGMYVQRPRFVPQGASSWPIVLAVIGLVVGLMFVGTCAALHAACN
jgi:hypothetical protein